MSDDASLEEMVVEETTDRVDVSTVLGEGSLEDEIDADEIGASVGARLGERVGRSLGEEVGGAIHESLSSGIEQQKGLREMAADVATAVREAIVDALDDLEGASGIVSTLRGALEDTGVGESLSDAAPSDAVESGTDAVEDATESGSDAAEGASDAATDAVEEVTGEESEDEEEAESEDEETDADETTETEGESDEGAEADADAESGRSAEELSDLRRETLENFLDVMSYEDLQSVAKEVGVKANLSREEMSERIVETVTDDGDSSDGSDDESGSDDGSRSDAENQSDGEAA